MMSSSLRGHAIFELLFSIIMSLLKYLIFAPGTTPASTSLWFLHSATTNSSICFIIRLLFGKSMGFSKKNGGRSETTPHIGGSDLFPLINSLLNLTAYFALLNRLSIFNGFCFYNCGGGCDCSRFNGRFWFFISD